MATKCIVIGEEENKVELKPIEFLWVMLHDKNPYYIKPSYKPDSYKNIELVHRAVCGHLDLMLAYDVKRKSADRYLGHWNDGIA